MVELEKFVVSADASILDTMNKINKNASRIVYVVDEDNVLIGSITDGDIRRYILNNQSLNGLAKDVMNDRPVYLAKENLSQAARLIKEKEIISVAIVDKNKKLIYIEFDKGKKFYDSNKLDIPVVIMAGGKGTRLYPYTQILPKPLISIGEKTITEHIMDNFECFGCSKFTMIVNYKKELIKAFFKENENKRNVDFVEESEFRGTAGGLCLLKDKFNSTFFMSNCDILVEENYGDILKYHRKNKNIITLVCALKKEVIPYGTVITDENGNIKKLKEKPELEFLTNTGLYVIEPEFLKEIPEDTFIHITDVIQNCIDKGLKVGAYPISAEAWMDMGQIEEMESMIKRIGEQ